MNLVFDYAGVLFRWQPQALIDALLGERSIPAELFFQGYGGDWEAFDRGQIDPGPLAMRIAMRTPLTPSEALRVIEQVPWAFEADPAMVELVDALHAAGTRLFFLSNMPAPYALVLEARHAFLGRFLGGLYSGRVGLVKPEPALFEHATAVFGVEPQRTLFFDDVMANVDGAQAAGWQALRFESAAQCRAALAARGLV